MFEPSPDRLRARLELHDTRGRTLATRRIEAPATDPFGFLERTYRAAAEMLRLPRRAGDPASEYGLRGAGTLRFHLQALGRLRMAKSETDARAAADEFERACMAEPRAAVPWAGLSAAQIKAFTFSEDSTWLSRAEGSARKAVEMDPSRPEAHRVLGHVFATEKRQEDARMEFARASDLDPTDDVLRYQLGRTYFRLGQPQEEKEIYLATQRRRPHDSQPAWWIAAWEYRAGHVEESIRRYRDMIRLAPLSEKAYASLGGLLVLHGDYDAAADTLKLAIALRPTMAAFSNLGTAYFNSGRFRESADAYNQSLQFGEPDDQTWLNVGDAYFWLEGREAEARRAYAEAIRLGREEMARRTREGRSFNVLIPARLATIYSRLGQRDSAQLYLDRALRADSANSMVQYQAALTRWQLGDREAALAWLEKSVQGGYPTVWLRDSPMFREWRERPEFRALAEPANLEPPQAASRN